MVESQAKPTICGGCKVQFPSKSAVFKHLKDTVGACLSEEERKDFQQYLDSIEEKSLILYGYSTSEQVPNGDKVAEILLQTLDAKNTSTINRSYTSHNRESEIAQQDEQTGAISEVIMARIKPLDMPLHEWINYINEKLESRLTGTEAKIRVLGRLTSPHKNFNATTDATNRRAEYLLPADFLYIEDEFKSLEDYFLLLKAFPEGHVSHKPTSQTPAELRTIKYLFALKKIMQSMTTKQVELEQDEQLRAEKEFLQKKRNREEIENGNEKPKKTTTTKKPVKTKPKMVLKRRRYHNFSPSAMAHDFLAYRRVDRFYHRATLHFQGDRLVEKEERGTRPFIVLSVSGDIFLEEQVRRMVGLFVAIAHGYIDSDIIECVLDEEYPHLVPTPPMPNWAYYAVEAGYSLWEGKVNTVLTPRRTDTFEKGWNDADTLRRIQEWSAEFRQDIVDRWLLDGESNQILKAKTDWFTNVLKPWSEKARANLEEYRQWKTTAKESQAIVALPAIDSIDKSVPDLFDAVLRCLREVDQSGSWPSTSAGRQLVMVSTPNESDSKTTSLAIQRAKMKANDHNDEGSAYTFQEGEGGASGSFSVGIFPGNTQPRANDQFPELMKAAFELEVALYPDREPSSTIAINRNAQFRPHVDSGAGAGQSTSLIVGLGDYVGGELVVEGERQDIRYKAIEFNGWKQRHWTMPFKGERYSLVWFTPKGCEGKRGIDICK